MPRNAALPLQRHQTLATRDPEEARAFLRLREFRLGLSAREAVHLDMRINGVFLPGLYLGYLQYGAAVEIRTDPSYDDYRLAIPIRGRFAAATAGDAIACGPGTAILLSPTGYLRRARFAKVRQILQRAAPEENVTGITMNFGFNHMGRFAVEYRRRFGESPSQTLRQPRDISPAGDNFTMRQ